MGPKKNELKNSLSSVLLFPQNNNKNNSLTQFGDAVVERTILLLMANNNTKSNTKGEREYKQVPLFGNCVTVLIPLEWLDVSDYRPVPDNQEMFSDFNSKNFSFKDEPSMVCVEIVERVGDDVTGVHSTKFREEDNLAKFYLEDLKELMDITTRDDDGHSKTIRTKDWRYELSSASSSSGRKVHSDLRAIFVDGKNEDAKKEAMKKMEDLSLTLPEDDGEEEREGKPKKENDDDGNDYVKNKCEWISFAEEKNCLVPSKENEEGKDSTRLVTISMYVHRLEKKYETDILVSFVRPSSKSDANHRAVGEDEIEEQNNPGTVAQQTLRMLDWSLLGLDDSDDVNDDDDEESLE